MALRRKASPEDETAQDELTKDGDAYPDDDTPIKFRRSKRKPSSPTPKTSIATKSKPRTKASDSDNDWVLQNGKISRKVKEKKALRNKKTIKRGLKTLKGLKVLKRLKTIKTNDLKGLKSQRKEAVVVKRPRIKRKEKELSAKMVDNGNFEGKQDAAETELKSDDTESEPKIKLRARVNKDEATSSQKSKRNRKSVSNKPDPRPDDSSASNMDVGADEVDDEELKKQQDDGTGDTGSELLNKDVTIKDEKKIARTEKARLGRKRKRIRKVIDRDTSIDLTAQKLIDCLDLNVCLKGRIKPNQQRRPSADHVADTADIKPFTKELLAIKMASSPVSVSPTLSNQSTLSSPRAATRQSSRVRTVRVGSPYGTRLDLSRKIPLRGAKRTADDTKKRDGRDGAGSDLSKMSGYESESSYAESINSFADNEQADGQACDSENNNKKTKGAQEVVENGDDKLSLLDQMAQTFNNAPAPPVAVKIRRRTKIDATGKKVDKVKDEKVVGKVDEAKNVLSDGVSPSFFYGDNAATPEQSTQAIEDVCDKSMEQDVEENKTEHEQDDVKVNDESDVVVGTVDDVTMSEDNELNATIDNKENLTIDNINFDAVADEKPELIDGGGDDDDDQNKILHVNSVDIIEPTVPDLDDVTNELNQNNLDATDEIDRGSDVEMDKERGTKDVTTNSTLGIHARPEDLKRKLNILNSVGLQSLKAEGEAKLAKNRRFVTRKDPFSGLLKDIIRMNKNVEKRKRRGGDLKLTLHRERNRTSDDADENGGGKPEGSLDAETAISYYKITKESALVSQNDEATWAVGAAANRDDRLFESGAQKKSHLLHINNRSNPDDSDSEDTSSSDEESEDKIKRASSATKPKLVIPEKSSSFAIHPQRLCTDECLYCFGRFGMYDTPCHIAQIKSVERQKKILDSERHLTAESCLCDACFRHVDRKANKMAINKSHKSNSAISANVDSAQPTVAVEPRICSAVGCSNPAVHQVRKKWVLKMKRSLSHRMNIQVEAGLHLIPICTTHYETLEFFMWCAICKRRLTRTAANHIAVAEIPAINEALEKFSLPVRLGAPWGQHTATQPQTPNEDPSSGTPPEADSKSPSGQSNIVCKLCRYFCTLLLKPPVTRPHTLVFFKTYRQRILQVQLGKSLTEIEKEENENGVVLPSLRSKSERRKLAKNKRLAKKTVTTDGQKSDTLLQTIATVVSGASNDDDPATSTLPVNDNNETDTGGDSVTPLTITRVQSSNSSQRSSLATPPLRRLSNGEPFFDDTVEGDAALDQLSPSILIRRLPVKDPQHVVELHKIPKRRSDTAPGNTPVVDKLTTNPALSVRSLLPGEEDLPLRGNVQFNNVRECTPEGWKKCMMTVQYDEDTERLWSELQKPYGNQSSFLRHLVLLEKYFRQGDLVLTTNASPSAQNYCESVQNRNRAYDNIPSTAAPSNIYQLHPSIRQNIQQNLLKQPTNAGTSKTTTSTGNELTITPQQRVLMTELMKKRGWKIPPGFICVNNQSNSTGQNATNTQSNAAVGAAPSTQSKRAISVTVPVATFHRIPNDCNTATPTTSAIANNCNKAAKPNQSINARKKSLMTALSDNKASFTLTGNTDTTVKRAQPSMVQLLSNGKSFSISVNDFNRMYQLKRENDIRKRRLTNQLLQKSTINNTGQRKAPVTATITSSPSITCTPVETINLIDTSADDKNASNTVSTMDLTNDDVEYINSVRIERQSKSASPPSFIIQSTLPTSKAANVPSSEPTTSIVASNPSALSAASMLVKSLGANLATSLTSSASLLVTPAVTQSIPSFATDLTPSVSILPKIPKSLTVIPQSKRRPTVDPAQTPQLSIVQLNGKSSGT